MTIILTGAGSGGHITPVLAVAAEIKSRHPKAKLVYIGQTGDGLGDIPAADPHIDEVYTVRAGKFRRYHGEGLKQLLDLPTMFKNIRDFFFVLIGLGQAWRRLRQIKPDVIFIKGGFVGVPVGLAAAHQGISYITHDSDAVPGLANRIIARWASRHAVALPEKLYKYPAAKTTTTGIPLQADFKPVTDTLKQQYRHEMEIPIKDKLIFVIGGGLGSQRINRALAQIIPHLMAEFPNLWVAQSVGRANLAEMEKLYQQSLNQAQLERLCLKGYIDDVYRYSGAADIVVTRAGATNLAEFALQGKACVVIPSPFLTGGHQLKNANYLAAQNAAEVMDESDLLADPNRAAILLTDLLNNPDHCQQLGNNLAGFAHPNATKELTDLILEAARETGT